MKAFFWFDAYYGLAIVFLLFFLHAFSVERLHLGLFLFFTSLLIVFITTLNFYLRRDLIYFCSILSLLVSVFFVFFLPKDYKRVMGLLNFIFALSSLSLCLSDFYHNQIVEFPSSLGQALGIVCSSFLLSGSFFSFLKFLLRPVSLLSLSPVLKGRLKNIFTSLLVVLIFCNVLLMCSTKEQSDFLVSFFTSNKNFYNQNTFPYPLIFFSFLLGFFLFLPYVTGEFDFRESWTIFLKGTTLLMLGFSLHHLFLIFIGGFIGTSGLLINSKYR